MPNTVKKTTKSNLPKGLTNWWSFNNTINNLVSTNNPAECRNFKFSQNRKGIQFDDGGGIEIPPSSNFEKKNFTIEAWVKPSDKKGSENINDEWGTQILAYQSASIPSSFYELSWSKVSKTFRFSCTLNGHWVIAETKDVFLENQYYQVVAIFKERQGSTPGFLELYVNGDKQVQVKHNSALNYNDLTDAKFVIGTLPFNYFSKKQRTWLGEIGTIRMYSKCLNQQQISQLYSDYKDDIWLHTMNSKEYMQALATYEAENTALKTPTALFLPPSSSSPTFFKPTPAKVGSIITATFLLGCLFLIDDHPFENPSKAIGRGLISLVLIVLAGLLAEAGAIAFRKINNMVNTVTTRADEFSQVVIETVRTGNEAIKEFKNLTIPITTAINDLRKNANSLTTEVIALVKTSSNTLIELQGNATTVANALEYGIKAGKFQPKADIKVNVHDNDVSLSAKPSIFGFF
jgi:hypothetical protein